MKICLSAALFPYSRGQEEKKKNKFPLSEESLKKGETLKEAKKNVECSLIFFFFFSIPAECSRESLAHLTSDAMRRMVKCSETHTHVCTQPVLASLESHH